MKAVREAGVKLKDGVRLILGCDEETGMTDMRYYAEHSDMPDYGFSPDAEFPVINIEKGGLSLNLVAATGGEDGAELPVYELYAGVRQNVVPGMAWAKLGVNDMAKFEKKLNAVREETGFELNCEYEDGVCRLIAVGQSAHASVPHLGRNAAGMLLIALDRLNAGGGSRRAIKGLAELLGLDGTGRALGIACEDEISGALTCNLGILRYDQNRLSARLDIRYPLCANEEMMCGQAVKSVAKYGMGVELAGLPRAAPRARGAQGGQGTSEGLQRSDRHARLRVRHRRRHLFPLHAEYRGLRPDLPGRHRPVPHAGRIHGSGQNDALGAHTGARHL